MSSLNLLGTELVTVPIIYEKM